MAEPVLTLDAARVAVDPGAQARITVTIANTGTIVEGYALELLGEPAAWAQVTPTEVSVYPQQTATAVIIFSPPAGSAAPSGVSAFGIRARSVVDPDSSAVAEGDVDVGTVLGLQAEITPATSSGRWRGRHTVEFRNWGNAAARLRVSASDPDEALGFLVRPDLIDIPLGGAAKVRVIARTRKPFLRGTAVRLPFQVVGEREDAEPQTGPTQPYADPGRPVADAALNQKPILSRAVVIIGGLILAAIVAGGVYAWTRPQPAQTFQQLGTPPTPELTAEAIDHDTVRLRWQPIDQIQSYKLLTIDPETSATTGAEAVPADQDQKNLDGLTSESENCFQLQAVRGNLQSPRSERACATTTAAPATASPSAPQTSAGTASSTPASAPPSNGTDPGASTAPTTSPSGPLPTTSTEPLSEGQWIAAAQLFAQPVTSEALDTVVDRLALAGLEAEILDSTAYPEMAAVPGTPLQPSMVVYVGPFDTEAEALETCTLIDQALQQQLCLALQPDPPQ